MSNRCVENKERHTYLTKHHEIKTTCSRDLSTNTRTGSRIHDPSFDKFEILTTNRKAVGCSLP